MSDQYKDSIQNIETLRNQIEIARGVRPANLLLRGGKVVNVLSGEVYQANIAISNSRIAGVGDYYQEGVMVHDVEGLYLIPGLIDAHVHIESSMLSPPEYARAVLPHGTTTIICDPHEIANVMGMQGIRYILDASRDIPLNLFITASSCVPSTHLETSGASFSSKEIEELLQWKRVVGLAEMMNVPGILSGRVSELSKILTARKKGCPIDGHSPSLSGKDLNAYIGSGIRTDHESATREEALEKLRLGMYLMLREGSAARDIEELIPVITPANHHRCMFVSDDRHPRDLLKEGHMDHILRKGIQLGMDPVIALSMATINPAKAFMIEDIGAISPGYYADIVAVKDLEKFKIHTVFKNGKIVVREGEIIVDIPCGIDDSVRKMMRVKNLSPERLRVKINGHRIRVMELIPGHIYTRHAIEEVYREEDGEVKSDISKDLLKIAVIERHHATGNIGLGFVRGFGLKQGAIGSSVAHDSHNIIVIGTNDFDMYMAVLKIIEMGGGHVVVSGGKVLGSLQLPIVGLLSDRSLEEIVVKEEKLLEVVRELGVKPVSPFIKLSFLALPVIPELKVTDKGLVDVNRFEVVSIEP